MKQNFKTLCLKFLKDIKVGKTCLHLIKTKPFFKNLKTLKLGFIL
ncbi:hypothetical protein HPHPH9_0126 [Helicobacter pylori Hp H-9]|nr:hypothetical protein HPHPH9_0126 [Helicobacter pylori Hp H-9]